MTDKQTRSLGRLLTDECLKCGERLLLDHKGEYNKYHCCSSCTKDIEREVRRVLNDVDMGRKAHKHEKKFAFKDNCMKITKMGGM